MKRSIFYLFLIFSISGFSQIGIGTTSPSASLDINGNVRIRSVNQDPDTDVARDSVLVISKDGTVNTMEAVKIISAALPTAVKGNFSSSGLVNLSLLSGSQTITFDSEAFDMNDEFDLTSHTFTANNDGIYSVYVQIEASSSLGIATNFGVQILKNGTVENRNSFANVGILGTNATPPVRSSQTLLQLTAGDTITFRVEGDIALGSVNLLGTDQDSYFTIHQIR
ncbi:BclA C-terminal domain-containing protein [Constantimarinum furrinae]|uniref:C1q domain-containing protein n=1 Tax=Constantimarinum furrinae TaxID=2562285 RepID=A0A7G8PQM6_9FLAO|nr:hypothetical protein [Constantimarinum furrinae]QNJ96642.1 hypothetical protein ALE3EI_0051 [Constantimarinum furrinae]